MINQHPDFIGKSCAPIGVFDSGVGGLSVYRHLKQLMPCEHFIYYADTMNVPYGNKSGDEILLLTLQAVARLCKQGCKLIVIACNSASAHALKAVRERCNVPIVGLVPAVKPACQITKTKKIAVLATRATLGGYLLNDVIEAAAIPFGIWVEKCFEPMLVPWVEAGMPSESPVAEWLCQQVDVWARREVDVVVLGCTHYPFFAAFLEDYIHRKNLGITLLDSGAAIAERVHSLLQIYAIKHRCDEGNQKPLKLYITRIDDALLETIKRLSGERELELIYPN